MWWILDTCILQKVNMFLAIFCLYLLLIKTFFSTLLLLDWRSSLSFFYCIGIWAINSIWKSWLISYTYSFWCRSFWNFSITFLNCLFLSRDNHLTFYFRNILINILLRSTLFGLNLSFFLVLLVRNKLWLWLIISNRLFSRHRNNLGLLIFLLCNLLLWDFR